MGVIGIKLVADAKWWKRTSKWYHKSGSFNMNLYLEICRIKAENPNA
jgi:hypothetical protein